MSQAVVTTVNESSRLDERTLIVSSDGHATAEMPTYRDYMPAIWHDEFDAFCEVFKRDGARTTDPESLLNRLDAELVDDWVETVINPGRLAGQADPYERQKQLDSEGIAGEIIFPDFGLPFELHPPLKAAVIGYSRTPEQVEIANRAYNRWLVDFCSASNGRFGGMAVVSFADVQDTISEIRWAKEHGLVGVVLPTLDESTPFYHPRHEPIWTVLEELEMPVNSHTAISSVTNHMPTQSLMVVPHPACAAPIMTAQAFFFTQQILAHLIWGGVLESHPNLQVVLTEQGSGWVIGALRGMDYSYDRSYLRRDIREVVKHRPSEYFQRQVHMGSSLFSRAEAENRYEIGIDKITIGMDYPHHEGTWGAGPGTVHWLRATLGAAGVTPDEARQMLGENAASLWGLDPNSLQLAANRIGLTMEAILTPPKEDFFPRGDVNKPLTTAF